MLLLQSQGTDTSNFTIFMILIMALLDMLGVASILPFMTVITNPTLIETNSILNFMFETSKFLEFLTMNSFL